ncbi:GNAT family N-acetyltransferase [Herbaspirillum rhizosphaerae]|uniref:GNAT family N-acetyltransferase n=1 Tax=Herbaspirillum rhizosphaerae TaxID=346179 RepID=UPI00067B42E2|nr:GNAT family N-acetyltransferase [Herbaspirillum rhizosphaerae]
MSQKNAQDNDREPDAEATDHVGAPVAGALRLNIVRHAHDLAALASEWDALSGTLPFQVPFTTASWNILWWQHLRAARMLIRDRLHVFVLRDRRGKLVAVAPMIVSMRPGVELCGVSVLQFFGADPNITEIRGMICHPDHADAAIAVLQDYLRDHKQLWDWIEWQGLSPAQAELLSAPGVPQPKARVMCYLPLPPSWEDLKHGLSRNMKEAIRKCFNSLRRDGHQHAFSVIEHTADVAPALMTFLRLHKLRAMSPEGVFHPNVFRDRKSRQFLTAYAGAASAQGQLRIFQLSVNGAVVASRIGFLSKRQLYLYYSGYDTAWGKYSVMTTLLIHIMQWAIAHELECVNLSTGKDQSKLRWQPLEAIQHNAVQISPRLRSDFLFKAYTHLRSYPFMHRISRKK